MIRKKHEQTLRDSLGSHLDHFFKMHGSDSPESGLYHRIIEEVEGILIEKTIEHTGHTYSNAAQILGINRNTLRKKLKKINHNK